MFMVRFQKSARQGMDFFISQQMSKSNSSDQVMEEILDGFHLREKGSQCDIDIEYYFNFYLLSTGVSCATFNCCINVLAVLPLCMV